MGMAAGQARLLSITARLSDNELRAQIINNNKMRLASESSQVSDHYVQALNEAELMFANYDADNNASFKQLTYNALTSYNPYNNQYALTNASGNMLLSERDYKNYKSSDTLEDFLECYGLKQTTTFFENLKTNDDGFVVFTNPAVEDDPTTPEIEAETMSTGLTPKQLELAYLGVEKYKKLHEKDSDFKEEDLKIEMNTGVVVEPQSYETTLNSELYNEYLRYLDKYYQTYEEFTKSIAPIMDKEYEKILQAKGYNSNDALLDAIRNAQSTAEMQSIMQKILDIIGANTSSTVATSPNIIGSARNTDKYAYNTPEIQDDFYKELYNIIAANMGPDQVTTTEITPDATGESEFTLVDIKYKIKYSGTPPTLTNVIAYNEDGTEGSNQSASSNNFSGEFPVTVKDVDGNDIQLRSQLKIEYVDGKYKITETLPGVNTLKNMQNKASSAVKALKGSIANCWDPMKSTFITQEPALTLFNKYNDAAKELGKVIYGDTYNGSNPGISQLGDPYVLYRAIVEAYEDRDKDPLKLDGPNGAAYRMGYPVFGPSYPNFDNDFYQIYLNLILDKVQDTYGEPHFSWIDTSTPTSSYNENGEAKAQWYTNIWNMCEKNGCKALKDGLASSTEWIQYAFESGIVNMQQVDENENWNPLIYTNCSDITSQTSDKMIAKAEAEYNAAMNKIENKDKRYDMELKNIDTEHNSLMTEYESIKTAIDKNVERVFKLYS